MSLLADQQRARRRWVVWLFFLPEILLVLFLAVISVYVLKDAARQDAHSADAIVVFGAAEYDGRPSPVFRARLDHAFDLYQRQLAPVIITTGGAGDDPKYTEGGVGHDYLMRRGIPEPNLIAETQGRDSAESAERIGVIMRKNHMRTALAVSDEYHVFRIRKLLEHEGMTVYVMPRPDSRPRTSSQRALGVLREATSYLLWRLHIT
jgi:uncharacterized SAM-binding protein YcdF (DUF218 family)